MTVQRFVVLLNPVGGSRRAGRLFGEARPRLAASGNEVVVHETRRAGHAMEIARDMAFADGDLLVVVGGDGTLHEVINGLMQRKDGMRPPLGLLPGGTGNSLAHDLGVTRLDAALSRMLAGKLRKLDVVRLEVDGRRLYAFNIIGWALPATAGARAERLRWLGRRRYDVAALIEIFTQRPIEIELSTGDESWHASCPFVLACNTRHTATAMNIAPSARFDDGLLDLLVVKQASRMAMLGLLAAIGSGHHLQSPLVNHRRVSGFRLDASTPGVFNVDGELMTAARLSAEVIPGAVQLAG